MTKQPDLNITIKPSKKEELDLLEKEFSPNSYSNYHFKRYGEQEKDEGIYLIAWHNATPIGHLLLRWNAYTKDLSNGFPNGVPYLVAIGTKEAFRRKGIATKLIQTAEKLVKEKGFKNIGLAVGSKDNPNAKRLYEKLGYKDWGKGEITQCWEYIDKQGNKGVESEVCIYMLKNL